MTDYSEYQVEGATRPLQRPWGRLWNAVVSIPKDAWREAAKQAVKARFASIAPVDALDRLLRDYDLPPRFEETVAQTRARLADVWTAWQLSGTKEGIVRALALAGFGTVIVHERLTPGRWWEFRVTLRAPFPWDPAGLPLLKWGGGWTWGQGFHFTGASPSDAYKARVLALIKHWKPAHERLLDVEVQLEGPYWGEFSWGDGSAFGGTSEFWV